MAEKVVELRKTQDEGRARRRRRSRRVARAAAPRAAGGAAADRAGVGAYFYLMSGRYISTDNAYVGAQKVLITPDISGKIARSR
jgi:membrane fusion protein (multidrug efflux system)